MFIIFYWWINSCISYISEQKTTYLLIVIFSIALATKLTG